MRTPLVRPGLILGPRIPRRYFCTAGFGQSDVGSGVDPYETGAYDAALMAARIANFHIVKYSSVLPPEAVEVPIEAVVQHLHHGAVLETIMASVSATTGSVIVAAVGRITVYDQHGMLLGGFAAEFADTSTTGTPAEAEYQAREVCGACIGSSPSQTAGSRSSSHESSAYASAMCG